MCVCLHSLSFLVQQEKTWNLSASITHLIHHRCQTEGFRCQKQVESRNVVCVCVCVPSSTSLLLFLLYNASLREASVSLGVYMCSRTLPSGLTRRPESRLTGDGPVKHADRQEDSNTGRVRQNGEVRGSNKADQL